VQRVDRHIVPGDVLVHLGVGPAPERVDLDEPVLLVPRGDSERAAVVRLSGAATRDQDRQSAKGALERLDFTDAAALQAIFQ
jgi:hypothetical protein